MTATKLHRADDDFLADFQDFIVDSPSSYHAAARAAAILETAGFTELSPSSIFPSAAGSYYLRLGGAVIAWRIGTGTSAAFTAGQPPVFRIVAAHTDSPGFKLKPVPDFQTGPWGQLGVEVYGGPLWNSWLDRDLGIAGRIVDADGVEHLVKTGAICRIAQLAPHLDRSVNGEGLKLDPENHLRPIWYFATGSNAASDPKVVLDHIAKQAGLKETEQIYGHDLYLYDTQAPALTGTDGEFFSAGRLDNLSSSYPALRALIDTDAGAQAAVQVVALFDHEEIGSRTTTGAQSSLLPSTLRRIAAAIAGANGEAGQIAQAWERMAAVSTMVSADAGHLTHPNYADKHDPAHLCRPGGGTLVKVNAAGRYTSQAPTIAMWKRAAAAAGTPIQHFVSNNNVPCGSTVGPFLAAELGIDSVDVGIGLLAMHSVRELCASVDLQYLRNNIAAYLSGKADKVS